MTAGELLVHLAVVGRICPTRVVQPNWKAECVERRPLRLEWGKDCKVLPILTGMVVTPSCYSAAGWVTTGSTRHRIAVRLLFPLNVKGLV